MADTTKIDKLLQFVLLTAGQEDDFSARWLSRIHLIKYVYLADLAYAKEHDGKTYTGLDWRFHHYGPWTLRCFERIEPSLLEIHAEKRTIESRFYENDTERWYASNDQLYNSICNELPIEIAGTVIAAVHRHGSDTNGLLHNVYRTIPMLKAAPEELLDFRTVVPLEGDLKSLDSDVHENMVCYDMPSSSETQFVKDRLSVHGELPENSAVAPCSLTPRQMRKRKELLREMKGRLREKLGNLKQHTKHSVSRPRYNLPRYDKVYFDGLEYLESLAGEPIEPGTYEARFSDEIWKSKSRFDPDLPR